MPSRDEPIMNARTAGYAPLRRPQMPPHRRWPSRGYFVAPRYKLLYAPIQKVACSSIKLWFEEIEEGRQALDPTKMESEASRKEAHTALADKFIYFRWYELLGDAPLVDPGWFRFAIVRNPWSRLVSAFLNKFVDLTDHGTLLIDEFVRQEEARLATRLVRLVRGPVDWTRAFTFRHFVRHLALCDLAEADLHWRPQVEFLADTQFHVVGRMEQLEHDLTQIRDRLKIDTPLRLANATAYEPPQTSSECVADWPLERLAAVKPAPHWRRFYTSDLAAKVGRLYAADVDRFGYEFAAGTDRRAA